MTTLRAPRVFGRAAALSGLGLAAAVLAGCGRASDPTAAVQPAADALAAAESGPRFLSPPQPLSAVRTSAGEVEIAGRAPPDSVVGLRNPDGQSVDTPAARDGGWTLRLPASGIPRLFALSATLSGRSLRGEGALLQAPVPGPPALLLRAGAPTLTLGEADGALLLDAVDFDGAGGLAISGRAPPQAALRATLDGRPAIAGQADGKGRFALMAVQGDLKPGRHVLHLEGAGRTVEAAIDATPAPPPPGKPYGVRPVDGGWRVDWATPGGGSQSSVIFSIGASGAAS